MVDGLRRSIKDLPSFVESRIISCEEEMNTLTEAVDVKIESILDDLCLVKRVCVAETTGLPLNCLCLSQSHLKGPWSSKVLENFLWDMETYFQAAHVSEAEKVAITSMYLAGDAKLWWCSRLSDDASENREQIETRDSLKKDLKDQFLPCNTCGLHVMR